MFRSHDLSCLSVFGSLPGCSGMASLMCLGAPRVLVGGCWRLLGALGACKIKIHRPCRCLGGSQVTISRACRCLEASQNALKSRSIVPVGVWRSPRVFRHGFLTCSGAPQAPLGGSWRLLGGLGACKIKLHRRCRCLGGAQITICRACRCLEASRNALKSRSIVPVGFWRPPRGLRGIPNHLRRTFDPPSTHLIVGGLGLALQASLEA